MRYFASYRTPNGSERVQVFPTEDFFYGSRIYLDLHGGFYSKKDDEEYMHNEGYINGSDFWTGEWPNECREEIPKELQAIYDKFWSNDGYHVSTLGNSTSSSGYCTENPGRYQTAENGTLVCVVPGSYVRAYTSLNDKNREFTGTELEAAQIFIAARY